MDLSPLTKDNLDEEAKYWATQVSALLAECSVAPERLQRNLLGLKPHETQLIHGKNEARKIWTRTKSEAARRMYRQKHRETKQMLLEWEKVIQEINDVSFLLETNQASPPLVINNKTITDPKSKACRRILHRLVHH